MREKIKGIIISQYLAPKANRSGKRTVNIRIQNKNENRRYSTGCEMTEKEWERYSHSPESDHPATLCFNEFVAAVKRIVANETFSFQNLSRNMDRRGQVSLLELISRKSREMKSRNKHSSGGLYENVNSNLELYLGGDIPLTRFSPEKAEGFVRWLTDERKNSPTTVAIKMECLNCVLNGAVKDGLIEANPLAGVRKPRKNHRNLAISERTLSLLLNSTPEDIGENHFYWLCFWRCIYYGNGMNVQDLLRLRRDNIRHNPDEIVFLRRKTLESFKKEIHVILIDELKESLSYISGKGEHLIPVLDGYEPDSEEEFFRVKQTTRSINQHLRRICDRLGIPEKISTGTGRHAFATRLMQKKVPITFISEALGHSSIVTTQNYLDGYTSEQRRENAELLKV